MTEGLRHDPGLAELWRNIDVDKHGYTAREPSIRDEEVVAELRGDCGSCEFASNCDAARLNAQQDADQGMADAYDSHSAAYDPLQLSDTARYIEDERAERLAAVDAFEAEQPGCTGWTEQVVRTTYVPPLYSKAGILRKAVMYLRGQEIATNVRTVGICHNPAQDRVINAWVDFRRQDAS